MVTGGEETLHEADVTAVRGGHDGNVVSLHRLAGGDAVARLEKETWLLNGHHMFVYSVRLSHLFLPSFRGLKLLVTSYWLLVTGY